LLAGAANLATGGGQLFRKLTIFLVAAVPVMFLLGLVRAVALLRRGTGATWRDAIGAFFIWQSTSLVVARASVLALFAKKAAFLRTPKTSERTRWWEALRGNWAESILAVFGFAGIAGALTKYDQLSGPLLAALLLFPTLGMAAAPVNSWAARRAALPASLRERRRTEYRRDRRSFAACSPATSRSRPRTWSAPPRAARPRPARLARPRAARRPLRPRRPRPAHPRRRRHPRRCRRARARAPACRALRPPRPPPRHRRRALNPVLYVMGTLEAQMDAKRLVEFGDERRRQLTDTWSDPLDSYRAYLLGLGFGVSGQSGLAGWQQHLECVNARDVRGHRDDGDHAPSEPGGRGVGRVIADHDRGPGLAGF